MNFAFLTRVARIDCHEAASSDRTLSKTLKALGTVTLVSQPNRAIAHSRFDNDIFGYGAVWRRISVNIIMEERGAST
jgi:hypothetical protein